MPNICDNFALPKQIGQNNHRNMHKNKENYFYYGCPGVVILIVSIMASLRVGADFGNDSMVRIGVFVACGILLWGVYEYVCQPVALGLCNFITIAVQGNKQIDVSQPSVAATVHLTHEPTSMEQTELSADTTIDLPSDSSLPSVSTSYSDRVVEYANEQAIKRATMLAAIDEYIDYWMPPFVSASDMPRLHEEVHRWADNPGYLPSEGISCTELSTYDLRHFAWNIAERLNIYGGYDGDKRARFIKALFPVPLQDIEIASLKNFRVTTYGDKIDLDIPEKGKTDFHYLTDVEEHAA
jgi:hypothetical protein